MADAATVFPAFIQARYDTGSSGFEDFKRDAAAAGTAAGDSLARNFRASAGELRNVLNSALSGSGGGALDLGVPQMRDAAQAAEQHAAALRQTAAAAATLAAGERELSAAQQAVFATVQASLAAAENDALTKREQVSVYEALQVQLNQTAAATGRLTAASGASAVATGAFGHAAGGAQLAQFELMHVIRSSADAFAAGQSATRIFGEEIGRVAEAATFMGPSLGRVGAFLSGPWGFALTAGVSLLSVFISSMNRGADASEHQKTALEELHDAVQAANDAITGLNSAQAVAIRHSLLMAEAAEHEAGSRRDAARATLEQALEEARAAQIRSQGPGQRGELGTLAADTAQNLVGQAQANLDTFDREVAARHAATYAAMTEVTRRWAEDSVDAIDRIRDHYDILQHNLEFTARQTNLAPSELARQEAALVRQRESALDAARAAMRTPRQDRRPDEARQELEDVTKINEQWDAQPKLVDQADQAVRRIQAILHQAAEQNQPAGVMAQLTARATQAEKSIRDGLVRQIVQPFDEAPALIVRATTAMRQLVTAGQQFPDLAPRLRAAGQAITDAVERPYRQFLDDQVRSFDTQRLISQGRLEEADALGIIARLEREMGPLDDAHRQKILDTVAALRAQAEQVEIIHQRQQAYTQATASFRTSIENLLANPQRGLAGVSDFFGSLTQTFNRLAAQVTTERLFGPILRQMDDVATGRTRLKQSNEALAVSMDGTRQTSETLHAAEQAQYQTYISLTTQLQQFGTSVVAATAAATNLANWRNAGSGPAGLGATGTETGRQPFSAISSGFGPRARPTAGASTNHAGYDFPQPFGTPILAPFSGQVTAAGPHGGFGNAVVIDIGNGLQSLDGHMSSIAVGVGELVRQGQIIGHVGSTGVSTGPHLHEEFLRNGQPVNPATVYGHDFQVNVAAAHDAVQRLGTGLADLTPILNGLTDSVEPASQVIKRAMDTVQEAIQGAGDIVVTAHRPKAANDNGRQPGLVTDSTASLNPNTFFAQLVGQSIGRLFGGEEGAVKMGKIIGQYTATAIEGIGLGQFGGSMVLGSGGNRTAEGIGGALGNIAGKALTSAAKNIFGSIGGFAGPVGSVVGGILGGLVGGLFKPPPPTGTAVISSYAGAPAVSGNNAAAQQQASDLADSVQQALHNVAQQLGGTIVDGAGRVAIGTYNGTVRVSPSGGPIHGSNTDSINYGTDTAAAVKAATLNLIQDGMIAGLRASTQRLLSAAKDLNTGLQNALDFEGVFTELKQHLDPVGAALDALDKRFEHLKELFKEAGASTEEYAQLEQLYQLDRKDAITQAGQQLTSALTSLLTDLTTNNQALSLRDRLASAHATYDPLAAKVAAGDTSVNYDDFAAAARALLDIQRQISGSNQPYFDLLAQVQELTKATLDHQQAQIDAASATDSPFTAAVDAGAGQTVSAIDQLGGLLVDQLGGKMDAMNDNFGTVIGLLAAQAGGGGSSGGFDARYNF